MFFGLPAVLGDGAGVRTMAAISASSSTLFAMMPLDSTKVMRLLLVVCMVTASAVAANMNDGPYHISNSASFPTNYHNHEYFDVYSPTIKTRYSEVFWTMQDPVPLPEEIQKRFHNKIMAVTGYEVNQVRIDDQSNEVPVPITWAYNHHYCSWLYNSNKTRLVKRKGRGGARMLPRNSHGGDEYWTAEVLQDAQLVNQDDANNEYPLVQFFSEGNGGEFRLSYHGYPKGYAQLVDSPNQFHFNPMQIDTWIRNSTSTKFHPGPLPKSSRIPASAGYSGLVECPCSDRISIEWNMTYGLQEDDSSCTGPIQNASECFLAATKVIQAQKHAGHTASDPSKPTGCTVEQHADGSIDAVWNSAQEEDEALRNEATPGLIAFTHAQVNVTVALDNEMVTITMVGPEDRWFGVAFGTSSMCIHMVADECPPGGPYAIVVSGDSVVERKLDYHGRGRVIAPSITVQSHTVMGGNRTVVLTRSLQGTTSDHYTFDLAARSMPIIAARGCGLEFAQHCGHGPSELNFLAVDTPARLCQTGIQGMVGGSKFDNDRCANQPYSDIKAQKNPTCSAQTYRGGLSCCHHGQSLLDKEQEIPWPDDYIEYRFKLRFYFEEYTPAVETVHPASHQNLARFYWQTELAAGEYDVTKCPEGVPPNQCIHSITSRWKVRDMLHDCSVRADGSWCTGIGSTDSEITAGVKLVYAGPHCHAPSCLSMELYNADTGTLLCHMEPVFGKSNEVFDENGFLAIPPCLWGGADEGLASPELLSLDTTLLSIKRNNSTLPHTGEMASWQMRGVVVPRHASANKSMTKGPANPILSVERSEQLRRGED